MGQWTKLQEKIQAVLTKEITLRQEILGNMNQQEYLLLVGDLPLKEEVYNECNKLIKQLKEVTKLRGILTRKLFDHLPPNIEGNTLDEILDPLVETESETLLLYNKTKSLVDKIHHQQLRNKTLQEMTLKGGSMQMNQALHPESINGKQRKKSSLITIDYPSKHPD